MAHLRLTVRNLYCYPCDLSFSNEDSFRNHHNSRHTIPFNSSLIDTKIETDYDAESDEIGSSSPTKNRKRRKKSFDMERENSNENTENNNKSAQIQMKSNPQYKEKNESVLQTSNKINLSKYKDYIHCCKCFSTFYTLVDLINHFDKCNVERDQSENFKDFKQQQSHSSFHQVNTKSTTTTEEESQLLNNDFVNEDDDEEQKKISKNDDYHSTIKDPTQSYAENLNVDSIPQTTEDQNENSCDNEIISELESGSEPEIVESESEMEEEKVKGEKKNSKGKSQQRQKPEPKERKERLPFKCPVESCSSLSFPHSASFLRHIRQVHNFNEAKYTSGDSSSVLCSTCGKSVPSQFELLCHMNEHTGYKPYKCDFENCDRSFIIRAKYLYHLQVLHKTKKDVLKCPEKTGCVEAFTNNTELRKHLQICHPDSRFYKCKKCDERFLTHEDRYTHQVRVHRELKFKCEVEKCGKLFKKMSGLKSHQISHQSERPFECDFPECTSRFKGKKTLEKHKRIVHQNQEQRLCSQCGKSFKHASNYRRHLLVHRQEKSYICQFCGRGFSYPTALKSHTLIHLGERPGKCRFCDKSFTQWGTLKRHEQTHTKINPYKCAFCDAVFPDNRPLKKHVAATHANEEFDLNVPSTYQREKPSASRNPIPIPIPETAEKPGQNT